MEEMFEMLTLSSIYSLTFGVGKFRSLLSSEAKGNEGFQIFRRASCEKREHLAECLQEASEPSTTHLELEFQHIPQQESLIHAHYI